MVLEIVVYNFESAMKAQEGGADRIELCDNPAEGGTTPSAGMIELVRQNLSIDVYAMIRPRGGDFCYSNYEFHMMKRDVWHCQRYSVDGVVFGILNPDGTLDKKRCQELIQRARPMKVTCHRAFDMTRDPFKTLEDCIEAGFDRILTSGLQTKAVNGAELIGQLVKQASGRIALMAGSGVNEDNVETIVRQSGVREIHFSAMDYRESTMQYKNPALGTMGTESADEYKLRTVDPRRIRLTRAIAEEAAGKKNSGE
jgi:copper homeostasis protein